MGAIDDDPTVLVKNPRARRVLLRVSAVLASLIVLWLVVYAAAVVFVMNAGDFPGSAHMSDFSVFWGAARLGVQGEAAAAFDIVKLNETMDIPAGVGRDDYRWMYPPTFHLIILPLGVLPYSGAWVAFAFGTLALFVVALAPHTRGLMLGTNTVLLAPVVVWSTLNANANMLTAAVLLLALQALGRGADRQAGLLIAFLAIKPTLALLIPLALAAGGHWRAFAWATFGVAVFVVATVAVFGADYWVVFFQALSGNLGEAAGGGGIPMSVMVTWLGFGRATGLGAGAAFWIQVIASAGLLVLTVWAWSRPWLDFRMKAAVLLIAAPLATPYAHYYEMTMTLAGIVLLLSSGVVRHRMTVVLLVAIWVLPILVPVRSPPVIPWLTAPMVTLLIVALAVEMARGPAAGAAPSRKSA